MRMVSSESEGTGKRPSIMKKKVEEEEEVEDEEVVRPPDGGWGWVVATGVFLIAVSPMRENAFVDVVGGNKQIS